jgi:hypothetical protein|tara:strand:+ start:665 stop:832 length:168 start_codon:yes stop_codon:yes gene_type:complete
MKCRCCDVELTDDEIMFQDEDGYSLDTCEICLSEQSSYYIEDEYIENLKDIGIDL